MERATSVPGPIERAARPRLTGIALVAGFILLASAIAAGAIPGDESERAAAVAPAAISPVAVVDGANSTDATRLLDGALGATDARSWANSGNAWSPDAYPMVATVDLGQLHDLTTVRYYGGQIPFPADASLHIEGSATGDTGSFTTIARAASPPYDRWSDRVVVAAASVRYIRVSFETMTSRFNISELAFEGTPTAHPNPDPDPDPDPGDGGGGIQGVTVADGANSRHAERLVDGVRPPGTDDANSWLNPNPWQAEAYPMTATFDLGESRRLSGLSYFVGNISQGTDRVTFHFSPDGDGENFRHLATVDSGHVWNNWRTVELGGQEARRIRIAFDSPGARFNISEVMFSTDDQPSTTTTTTPTATTTTTTGPTTTAAGPTTTTTAHPTTTTGPTTTTTPQQNADQPRSGPPPADVVRSHGFGNWPGQHLTASCRELHDSYWTQGPNAGASDDPQHADNKAYHTWHPAVAVNPATGERCDIGHEHGFSPKLAPDDLFQLSGGWPAFGYVAETMGGHRHEDHVGHKVTVAHFRASIGNGAGSHPLYDAGFECDWLSKIHQGSSTLDAFANHLHEYFLTLRCMDGLNANGVVDNTVVGTEFSVKVMYTYGNPNEFAEDGCSRDDPATPDSNETVFPASILTGPEGQSVMPAHQLTPIGNDSPNNRGFTCSSGVIWKDVSQIQSVDLWTQLIKIEGNDGHTVLTIQPYYIVKNPARIIEAYDGAAGERPSRVVRTISLCYDEAGNRLNRGFCNGAPAAEPDWRSPASPFNGALRAVNFKASHVQNAGGPARFCTDPFGFSVVDPLPCEPGHITQTASPFDNHWNDGRYRYDGQQGNIQGSIWAQDPFGNRFEAAPAGGGAYTPNGIGFEFIIDNRNPDDDGDGVADGANLRGQN